MEHQRFGKHILLERIATGGMAEVFKAKAFGVEGFEKILAIKRILPHVASDKAFIEMFINEAKILSALSHSSICQIFDLGQLDGAYFITMEYIAGKSLQTILQLFRKHGRTMPLTMAAYIVSRVCEGLDYVYHKVGMGGQPLRIVHRDVSPHNILVGHEGTVKLIDFGIARAKAPKGERQPDTRSQQLQGKFDYMSPEQVSGEAVDHRSDVFSVGVCLYELATNRHPFTGNTEFNTLENIRKLTPPAPSSINGDCTPELDAIIMKALEKSPGRRYERTGDLMEALQRFIISKPPLFNATSLSQFMRRTFARDIEDERRKNEDFAKVKFDGPPDETPTVPGFSDDLLARMAAMSKGEEPTSADQPARAPSAQPPAPAAPSRPQAKRTLIGMPAMGGSKPPPAPASPGRVARPIAPPSPTVPPPFAPPRPPAPSGPPMPVAPTGSRRAVTASGAPIALAPPRPQAPPAARLVTLTGGGRDDGKVVAIPTQPQFPAVRSPVEAPGGPSEADLDFDDEEAPTAVLDDRLASIVRSMAASQDALPPGQSAVPPPLPTGPSAGLAGPSSYEAEPRRGSRTWLLVLVLLLVLSTAGFLVWYLVLRDQGPATAAPDAAAVLALADTAPADAGAAATDTAFAEPADAAPETAPADAAAPPDAPATADAGAEAEPETAPDAGPEPDTAPDAGPEPDTAPVEQDAGTATVEDTASPPPRDTASPPPRDTARPPRDTAPPPPPRDTSRPPRDAGSSSTSEEGALSVISNPWSWVSIDGRSTGRKTPLVNYGVSLGIHRVCLKTEDDREYCTAVRIEAGRPARVVHNF